ncbi:hypothetical protein GCM10009544_56880 [Streptomyces stramineus]|uniref:Transposase n=1 Tax=Streptomyces stramineus TaxID=173861 RepID=A0ABN1B246_9ACTN
MAVFQRVREWLGKISDGTGVVLDGIERRHQALVVIAAYVMPVLGNWMTR